MEKLYVYLFENERRDERGIERLRFQVAVEADSHDAAEKLVRTALAARKLRGGELDDFDAVYASGVIEISSARKPSFFNWRFERDDGGLYKIGEDVEGVTAFGIISDDESDPDEADPVQLFMKFDQ